MKSVYPKKNPKKNLQTDLRSRKAHQKSSKTLKKKSPNVRAGEKSPDPLSVPASPVPEDTICGIATPPGEGGIGIIRISGKDSFDLSSRLIRFTDQTPLSSRLTHTLHHGTVISPETGERIDEVMVGLLRGPRSYTREDTVEVYCHGGVFLLRRVLDLLVSGGCRLARPGEFTQRAFLNGRIDLTRAEAVMDLISAKSEAARRAALAQLDGGLFRPISALRRDLIGLLAEVEAGLDFVEEELQFVSGEEISRTLDRTRKQIASLLKSSLSGRIVREGIRVAIVGNPNAGKSSLLNALLEVDRAIVSPHPGTTRDLVEDQFVLGGIRFRLIDTAGLRDSRHPVECEGIERAKKAIAGSDLVLLVVDVSSPGEPSKDAGLGEEEWKTEMEGKRHLIILNKIDLRKNKFPSASAPFSEGGIRVSALSGEGIEGLKERLLELARSGMVQCGESEALINERHKEALLGASQALNGAIDAVKRDAPGEILAMELRNGVDRLGEITGENTTEGLLDRIFSRFCIGK